MATTRIDLKVDEAIKAAAAALNRKLREACAFAKERGDRHCGSKFTKFLVPLIN